MIEVEKSHKKLICIVGPIGSGKDTVAEYISQKIGIPALQISQPLKDFASERGLEPTRENLIKLGNEVLEANGPEFFVERLLQKVSENLLIVTGVRIPAILEYMQERYAVILLSLTADPKIRFERSVMRNKLGEAKTFDEFLENEQVENSAPNAQRVFECMELADYSITNDGTVEELYKKVDEFLVNKSIK